MKFTRIQDALSGERTVAVEPRPAPEVDAPWQRERFVTGRTVSAGALEAEQDRRAGRVAGLGTALRAGVCLGLEAEAVQDDQNRLRHISVAAGWGLCHNGEDVVVPEQMLAEAGLLPVRMTTSVRFGKLAGDKYVEAGLEPTLTELLTLRTALARQIDKQGRVDALATESTTTPPPARRRSSALDFPNFTSLDPTAARGEVAAEVVAEVVSDIASLPRFKPRPFVAVLVLEPARVEELAGAGDPSRDPCERDPEAEPFEDWRYVDAARLCWVPVEALADERPDRGAPSLPEKTGARGTSIIATSDPRALPADDWFKRRITDFDGDRFRNQMAWALFGAEAGLGPDETLPWDRDALPIALVAFSGLGDILWLDRASVVRRGGLRTEGVPTGVERGSPDLWQARVEQFNEQLAAIPLDASRPLTDHLRYLPPAGILPRELLDTYDRACKAFPNGWGVNAAPIPLDQLDAALRGAAALDPYDLDSADNEEVKVLVPVAAPLWDPRLLQIETVNAAFPATMRAVNGRRDELLERRVELRAKISALYAAIGRKVTVPVYPTDDTGDTAADDVINAVLWANPAAFTVFDALGKKTTLPVLPDATAISGAALAFTADTAAAARIASALSNIGATDPVAVIPELAGATASESHGPGFRLPGGWTETFQVTHDEGQLAVAREPLIYVVQGTLDTEGIDAAATFANGRPIVILCAAVSTLAAEDLAFRYHRTTLVDPLVVIVRGDSATRLLRLADVAIRLGTTAVPGRATDSYAPATNVLASPVTLAVADTTGTSFLLKPNILSTSAAAARLAALKAARAASTDAVAQALLDDRCRVFEGKAAFIFAPDDGAHIASEQALAVRMIQSMRALTTAPSELGELQLLDIAASREQPYGTVPTPTGLGVAIVEELETALINKITPPMGQRVVLNSEIDLIGDHGIAGLMAVLGERAKRADDAADFGFLQLQALLFKIREQLMGRDKALQMSTSPVMANLADLIEGEGTPEQLSKFFDELKEAATPDPPPTPKWMSEAIQYTMPKETLYNTLGGYDPKKAVESLYDDTFEKSTASVVPTIEATQDLKAMKTLANDALFTSRFTKVVDTGDVLARLNVGGASAGSSSFTSEAMMMSFATSGGSGGGSSGGSSPSSGTFWNVPDVQSSVDQGSPGVHALGTKSVAVASMVHTAQFMRKTQPYAWTLRATGVKKRAEDARAIELRQEAFRLRAAVLQTIARQSLNLVGLRFPGFLESYTYTEAGKTKTGFRAVERELFSLDGQGRPVANTTLVNEVLQGKHDLTTPDANTASLNTDAIQSLEITASMLRIVESRVREVREVIELCRRAKIRIERLIFQAEAREDVILAELAEARHDVAATSALLAEEQARVDAVNAKREKILATEVPFVVYHRTRFVDLADDVALHDIEPALLRSPVLDALRRPTPRAPEELRDMIELWRDAPARWLRPLVPLLPKVDSLATLVRFLLESQQRAIRALDRYEPAPQGVRGLKGMEAVVALVKTRRANVVHTRRSAATLNATLLTAMNWRNAQVKALETLSVGDLINSREVRATVSKQAAAELENLYKISANLYREFAEVAPEIRALWVRMLSEYDDPIDLADLSRLPRWKDVGQGDDGRRPDPFKKRELQAMVTWLFDRIDPAEAEARELMNDLVRVSILLASHAPVERILSGQVETASPIEPGRVIAIKLPGAARVGMMAIIRAKSGLVTHARVEDIGEGRVAARITSAAVPGAMVQAGDQVQLSEPDGIAVEDEDDDGPDQRHGALFLKAGVTFDR